MKMTPKIVLTLLAIPVLMGAQEGYAKQGKQKSMKKLVSELGLSDEQKASFKEIRKKSRTEKKKLREKMKASRAALKVALKSNASESELRAKHNDHQALKNQMDNLRFERLLSIQKILTPEQRVKFHELKKDRKAKRKSRFKDE